MKPDFIICDIDGSVALRTQGRSPYDLTQVSTDTPNKPIVRLINTLCNANDPFHVIFITGRSAEVQKQTWQWLKKTFPYMGTIYMHLYMRDIGDEKKDTEVKRNWVEFEIIPNFNILYAFEDRNRCVEMYRSLGITTLQVAPGDF